MSEGETGDFGAALRAMATAVDPNEEWFLAHMAKHPELARAGITMEELRQATYAVSVVNWSADTTVVFESRRHAAALLATEALLAAAKVRSHRQPKTIDGTLAKPALPSPSIPEG